MKELGQISEIVRYPVKSMAGAATDAAFLGWHGLAGDRRFAFRRLGDEGGFPWLIASRVPELLLYHPMGFDETTGEPLPTRVRTPAGTELELRGAQLRDEIAGRLGAGVELMNFRNGIFDDAPVSVISQATIAAICTRSGVAPDRRRFRANIVLDAGDPAPFHEDGWVGGTLTFGDVSSGPAVGVTSRDVRCVMINLDPDTAEKDASVLKAAVALNRNNAGVYGTVLRTGTVRVGDRVRFATGTRRAGR